MTDFDRIFAAAPLNKTAGAVTSKSKDHYIPKVHIPPGYRCWDTPPPLKSIPSNCDLTGIRFGRFVVLGILDETRRHEAAWVVRCQCGMYEVRKARVIKRLDPEERCIQCKHTQKLINRGQQRRSIEDFVAENC